VQSHGFNAERATTALASTGSKVQQGFQLRLIDPVDVYQQATRSVKYGFLFIALSFAAFFVFEQLKSLRIHPIQYGLVGLVQAVFFLLLLSLSEHMRFTWAYAASASASVLLFLLLAALMLGTRKVDWYSQGQAWA
jgi:inner membrane protein